MLLLCARPIVARDSGDNPSDYPEEAKNPQDQNGQGHSGRGEESQQSDCSHPCIVERTVEAFVEHISSRPRHEVNPDDCKHSFQFHAASPVLACLDILFVRGEDACILDIESTVTTSNRPGSWCTERLVLLAGGLSSIFLCKHGLLLSLNLRIDLGTFAGFVAVHLGWKGGVLLSCSGLCITFA